MMQATAALAKLTPQEMRPTVAIAGLQCRRGPFLGEMAILPKQSTKIHFSGKLVSQELASQPVSMNV